MAKIKTLKDSKNETIYPVTVSEAFLDANGNPIIPQIEEKIKDAKGADGKSAYKFAQDAGYTGTETDFSKKLNQATFANPFPLTFTGAASATYDGSEAVTVDLPSGGSVSDYKTTTITIDADVDKVELLGSDVNATEVFIVFNGQCTDKSRAICFAGLFNATGKNDSINAITNRDVVVYLKKLNDSVGIQFIKADGYPANTAGTTNMSRCVYNKNKALGSYVQNSDRFKAGSKFEVLYR